MARGVVHFLSPRATTSRSTSVSMVSPLKLGNGVVSLILRRHSTRFFAKYSECSQVALDYNDAFAKRMEMASLKPDNRIAMGVSGGADSMGLCVMMAHWKKTYNANTVAMDSSGFIDGLLAIIVDHGLRPESKEEAETVSRWVSDMGIRSEIAHCDWSNGCPTIGHLEEAARDMRYQIFEDVCFRHQIGVVLIAHHADDQAELFILRLSRNSGVLGLAGMASASQLFPEFPHFTEKSSDNQGILMVRPLLEFTKEDLYKICEENDQKWVEDPTNRSSLFARNRIRMALLALKNWVRVFASYLFSDHALAERHRVVTSAFRSELQTLIGACRRTRIYIDYQCQVLLDQAVSIIPYGYAVINLKTLNPSRREDICLSKFLTLILQFISQRHRPLRGSALKLLLDYIRRFPCKTSVTAAGCYLCPAPGTKGNKVLVCCSVDSVLPSKTELCSRYPTPGLKQCLPSDVERIILDQKSKLVHLIPDASDVHFLNAVSSTSVLAESRRLEILSELTCKTITQLQVRENRLFHSKTEETFGSNSKNEGQLASSMSQPFQPGQSFYFVGRFFLRWVLSEERNSCNSLEKDDETRHHPCSLYIGGDSVAYIRPMVEEDWLYLAKLLKARVSDKSEQEDIIFSKVTKQVTGKMSPCSDYAKLSALRALTALKSIPAAARRGMPVAVSSEGILLSIPSVGFKQCPCLDISAEFRPRVPLGGGHSSFA